MRPTLQLCLALFFVFIIKNEVLIAENTLNSALPIPSEEISSTRYSNREISKSIIPYQSSNNLNYQNYPSLNLLDNIFYKIVKTLDASWSTLKNPDLPAANAGSDFTIDCNNPIANLDGSSSSSGAGFQLVWTDEYGIQVQTGNSYSTSIPGTYFLTVTDIATGCMNIDSVLVFGGSDLPIADAGLDDTLSCNNPIVTLNGLNSDFGNGFTHQWFSPDGTSLGFLPIINISEAGVYSLVVTNTNTGCSATSSVQVVQSSLPPNAIILPPNSITCNQPETILVGAMSSGSGPLNYTWHNSFGQQIGNTPNLTVTQSGIYILDVVDTNSGCVASMSMEVETDIVPPFANTNGDGVITCNQNSYTMNAMNSSFGSNFQYQWLDEDSVILSQGFEYTTTEIGVYDLIVTNLVNGCTAQSSVELIEDLEEPTSILSTNGILTCTNEEVELDGSLSVGSNGGNITLEWFAPNGNSIGNSNIVSVDEIGLYQLVVTNDENGCSAIEDILVEENMVTPQPSIEAITNLSLSCNQNSLVVDGSNSLPMGNVSYEWILNNNTITTIPNPEIHAPGELVLIVTDTQNGCIDSTSVNISHEVEIFNILIDEPDILTCAVPLQNLDATNSTSGSDYEYFWNGPGDILNEQTLTPTVNQTGTFTLTITNSITGCSSTESIIVEGDITPPLAIISSPTEFECNTISIDIDASHSSVGDNFSYAWDTHNGNISNNINTLTPTITTPGIYNLEITNSENGCTTLESIAVNESDAIISSVNIEINNPPCFGDEGSIAIEDIIGGTPPFMYSIDFQPFTSSNFYNFLKSDTYTIMIEDAVGCQYSKEVMILDPQELEVSLPASEIIRIGEKYELQPQLSIATSAIETITWSPIDSLNCSDCLTPTAQPTHSTYYEITVTDSNGCSATEGIWIYVEKPREIFIPNAFSPNEDGSNDVFYIFAKEGMVKQINKFQVFSRWGELVFANENFQPNLPTHGWDGRFNGKSMKPGVLFYFAEIEFIDGVVEIYKGDITLSR